MLTLPPDIMAILAPFALVLMVGAILAPGARMISSVLRVLGLDHLASFQT